MASIPNACAGFDRSNPINGAWDAHLYSHSNFVFQGAYLAHGPHENRRRWFQPNAYPALNQTGWGWCIWFLGFSVYAEGQTILRLRSDLDLAQLTAQAIQDGQRIKTMCHDLDADLAGCVVIFDNEDQADQQGNWDTHPDIITYYTQLFREMMTPGPRTVPAVRVGFYSHNDQASRIMVSVPDLFFWIAAGQHRTNPRTGALLPPFEQRIDTNRVELRLDWFHISVVQSHGNTHVGSIPLGGQIYYWKQKNMPTRPLGQLTPPVNDWDFDISFVRDPRYPHGEPRYFVDQNLIARGIFRKTDVSMVATVSNLDPAAGTPPTVIGGALLEPEAPLVLLPNRLLFSLSNGRIVCASQGNDGHWTGFANISTTADRMRRMRAFNAQLVGPDVYLFYVSDAHQLVTKRCVSGAGSAWSAAAVLQVQAAHGLNQLTNITATSSPRSVDVFFINSQGILTTTAPFLPNAGTYPAQNSVTLEARPSLLVGTALAAISPSNNFVLVFGISQTLNLRMGVWQFRVGWTALRSVGTPQDHLFAHSRLAVFIPARNRTTIYVGAVTDQNVPCIYSFQLQNNVWVPGQRQPFPKTLQPIPPRWRDPNPNSPLGPAFDYAVNPFGDVAIFEDPQGIVFAVTGVNHFGGTVLVKHIQQRGDWQSIR